MIKATIQFHSQYRGNALGGKPRSWGLTREFNDETHMNNYIAYMEREKNHVVDEVWIIEKTTEK